MSPKKCNCCGATIHFIVFDTALNGYYPPCECRFRGKPSWFDEMLCKLGGHKFVGYFRYSKWNSYKCTRCHYVQNEVGLGVGLIEGPDYFR